MGVLEQRRPGLKIAAFSTGCKVVVAVVLVVVVEVATHKHEKDTGRSSPDKVVACTTKTRTRRNLAQRAKKKRRIRHPPKQAQAPRALKDAYHMRWWRLRSEDPGQGGRKGIRGSVGERGNTNKQNNDKSTTT